MKIADFRSDTVTLPTPAMRAFMAAAPLGDDMFGEDPTVQLLEQETAALLGMEAAMFVPSGTMANQIAIHLHTRPGDSVLCHRDSHVMLYEAGAGAALSGVQFDEMELELGLQTAELERCYRLDNMHSAPTSLLVVENTHNRAGGRVFARPELAVAVEFARSRGVALHCDGARLWNAAARLKCEPKALVDGFTSASVCFSKGLGAPVGSALCGTRDFIARARKIRKRWGGAMRQSGLIAAGALFALRHHRARLSQDHELMGIILSGLSDMQTQNGPWRFALKVPEPATNMAYLRFYPSRSSGGDYAGHWSSWLAKQGVKLIGVGGGWLRAVTHLDVDESAATLLLAAVQRGLALAPEHLG